MKILGIGVDIVKNRRISILIKNQPKKRWANMFLLIKTLLLTK